MLAIHSPIQYAFRLIPHKLPRILRSSPLIAPPRYPVRPRRLPRRNQRPKTAGKVEGYLHDPIRC